MAAATLALHAQKDERAGNTGDDHRRARVAWKSSSDRPTTWSSGSERRRAPLKLTLRPGAAIPPQHWRVPQVGRSSLQLHTRSPKSSGFSTAMATRDRARVTATYSEHAVLLVSALPDLMKSSSCSSEAPHHRPLGPSSSPMFMNGRSNSAIAELWRRQSGWYVSRHTFASSSPTAKTPSWPVAASLRDTAFGKPHPASRISSGTYRSRTAW